MLQLRVFEEDNRQPTHLAIWLHGLGASGDDFLPLLPQFHHAGLALRFILPDAPSQAVTINAGMRMPALMVTAWLGASGKIKRRAKPA